MVKNTWGGDEVAYPVATVGVAQVGEVTHELEEGEIQDDSDLRLRFFDARLIERVVAKSLEDLFNKLDPTAPDSPEGFYTPCGTGYNTPSPDDYSNDFLEDSECLQLSTQPQSQQATFQLSSGVIESLNEQEVIDPIIQPPSSTTQEVTVIQQGIIVTTARRYDPAVPELQQALIVPPKRTADTPKEKCPCTDCMKMFKSIACIASHLRIDQVNHP